MGFQRLDNRRYLLELTSRTARRTVCPELFHLCLTGGYVAGCYLGRMACYGSLSYFLSRAKIPVSIIPGHLDTVGGLKPVREFFLRQAMVVGLPAGFIAVWLALMRFSYFSRYQNWLKAYIGLLFLSILFEITSFIAPLWWFHREMARQKQILLKEADKLSPEIARIQRELAECLDSDEMKALKERLEQRINRYSVIEQLPVWPVDLKARRVFSLSNVALFIPLLAETTGVAKPWAELAQKLLQKAGSGH